MLAWGRKFVGANVTGGECVKSGGERVRGLKVCIPLQDPVSLLTLVADTPPT